MWPSSWVWWAVGVALEIASRRDYAPGTLKMFGSATLCRARISAVSVDVAIRRDDDVPPGSAREGAREAGALSLKGSASGGRVSSGDGAERGDDEERCD